MRHPRDIRKQLFGLTQQELADAVSRTQASVSEWEARGIFPSSILPRIQALGRVQLGENWNDAMLFSQDTNSEALNGNS